MCDRSVRYSSPCVFGAQGWARSRRRSPSRSHRIRRWCPDRALLVVASACSTMRAQHAAGVDGPAGHTASGRGGTVGAAPCRPATPRTRHQLGIRSLASRARPRRITTILSSARRTRSGARIARVPGAALLGLERDLDFRAGAERLAVERGAHASTLWPRIATTRPAPAVRAAVTTQCSIGRPRCGVRPWAGRSSSAFPDRRP